MIQEQHWCQWQFLPKIFLKRDSTKHLNETGQKLQEETNQENCSHGSLEERNDVTKNDNEQKESSKRKTKRLILPKKSIPFSR